MSPPRVVFAPHLLQTLDSRKQPLRCTNLVRENVRASRTPGEPTPLRDRLAHARLSPLRHERRDRRRSRRDPEPRLRPASRALRQATPATPNPERGGLDQQTTGGGGAQRGDNENNLTSSCLT